MNLKFFACLLFIAALFVKTSSAQDSGRNMQTAHFHIYNSNGNPATLDDIASAMAANDVIFVGEEHDDPTAHALELELLRRAYTAFAANQTSPRPVALSLEMFERDVQTVLNEYLNSLITEPQFLECSRPWSNYQSDYRPLVEFARANHLPVVAANAPRRYANRVSRLGRGSLEVLSPTAKTWIAPLPYGEASPAYARKFMQLMHGAMPSTAPVAKTDATASIEQTRAAQNPHSNFAFLLDAQSLWDATMAYSISEQLKRAPRSLVVQINGKFHSEEHLGIPEHLARYSPGARSLVVTVISDERFNTGELRGAPRLGDFIILTDPALPRSRQ